MFLDPLLQSSIRAASDGFFRGVDPAALEVLGLDDDAFAGWSAASTLLVTLPHASPNVFHPRTRVAWAAGHVQRLDPHVHHLRLVLTHTNFSDMGWRPYCWWHLDAESNVRETRLFSRNKKRKHVVVRSQPPLDEPRPGLLPVDARAARHAATGTNLAASAMLVMATVERAAGMNLPGRTTYLPLEMLVAYAHRLARAPGDSTRQRWCRGLAGVTGRCVGDSGELEACPGDRAEVFDNLHNLAALALLAPEPADAPGLVIAGGAKMAGYWPEVGAACRSHAGGGELPVPRLLVVPEADPALVPGPGAGVAAQLAALGIEYSQGLAVAQHGDFAARSDPFDVPRLWRAVSAASAGR